MSRSTAYVLLLFVSSLSLSLAFPHTLQVWTVEPGVYFNPFVFESAYANATLGAMLNKSKIESYANFGGVRIEDTIVVLEQGTRVMSSAPKMPHDIEVLMGHA